MSRAGTGAGVGATTTGTGVCGVVESVGVVGDAVPCELSKAEPVFELKPGAQPTEVPTKHKMLTKVRCLERCMNAHRQVEWPLEFVNRPRTRDVWPKLSQNLLNRPQTDEL